jgi:hypothetical protein
MKTVLLKIKDKKGKILVNQTYQYPDDKRDDLVVNYVENIVRQHNLSPETELEKVTEELTFVSKYNYPQKICKDCKYNWLSMDDQDGVAGNLFDTHCYMEKKYNPDCTHWNEPPYIPDYHSPFIGRPTNDDTSSNDCITDYLADDDDIF